MRKVDYYMWDTIKAIQGDRPESEWFKCPFQGIGYDIILSDTKIMIHLYDI